MSGADLLEDGFPHSTPEGYKAGCRGRSCIGAVENGISCADAFARYQGDYGFRKKVDAGMSPKEIVAEAGAGRVVARPRPVSKPTARPLSADVQAQLEAVEAAAAVVEQTQPEPEPEPAGKVIPLEKHGTTKGYSAGCRLKDACPGVERVGRSCTEAVAEYQRELKAGKRLSSAAAGPTEAAVLPREVVTAVAEHELTGVDADGELCSCGNHDGSVVEHLASVALAIPTVSAEPVVTGEPAAVVVPDEVAELRARVAELERLLGEAQSASPAEVTTISDGTSVTVVITVQRAA